MTVDTKHVTGRRTLVFGSVEEILADAETCLREGYRPIGNWSMGQIFSHIAKTMHGSIDGMKWTVPWYVRWIAPLFKRVFLKGPMPAGYQLSQAGRAQLVAEGGVSDEQGLAELRDAVRRLQTSEKFAPSPVLGELTREETHQLHRVHAAMHLSFLVPQ